MLPQSPVISPSLSFIPQFPQQCFHWSAMRTASLLLILSTCFPQEQSVFYVYSEANKTQEFLIDGKQ